MPLAAAAAAVSPRGACVRALLACCRSACKPDAARARRRRVQLHRALSKLGLCSRSMAWSAIKKRRVVVNGRVSSDPLMWVDVDGDCPLPENREGDVLVSE